MNAENPPHTPHTKEVQIEVAGHKFVADVSGALWWPEHSTLLVADLHLEKGSSFARRGTFLPPYDSRTTLRRLADTMHRRAPSRIILLGDSFHDLDAMHRLPSAERSTLQKLQASCEWLWITGNHDPQIADRLGGKIVTEQIEHGLTLRHEPGPIHTTSEIAGHLHPAARFNRHGRSIRRRCFIATRERLILPAFGAYTGGLNICDPAFSHVFQELGSPEGPCVWMLGENGVYGVVTSELRGD